MNKTSDKLYLQLKDDIQQGHLPVGERLKQEQLAARYNVSRIPVRDALQNLFNQGWLVQTGKRGLMIPVLNAAQAEEIYLMRMQLEPLALQLAFASLSHADLGQAQDVLEQIDNCDATNMAEQGKLNWQFHDVLYRVSKRDTLLKVIAGLKQQSERYLGFQFVNLDYKQHSQQEHYQLLELLRKKDISAARLLLEQHICRAGELLVNFLRQQENQTT
jgi:DNA-binding GntR family transcriptional regulator